MSIIIIILIINSYNIMIQLLNIGPDGNSTHGLPHVSSRE